MISHFSPIVTMFILHCFQYIVTYFPDHAHSRDSL